MPLNLSFEAAYVFEPVILVTLRSVRNDRELESLAIIDTGAQRSLFDESLARRLGIDLDNLATTELSGIGGRIPVREAVIQLQLLGEPDLSVIMPVSFAPNVQTDFGNLLGLDVLTHFDLGLSHANRAIHLGVAAQP
jgi:hypothetical protein